MTQLPPRPRTLPIAPKAEPARRRLPLAGEARDVDRAFRPIIAVWELTLQCDLACRHCGSRAGRSRPDELSTEEALDLVRQLEEIGCKEVTVIGGEAYLRDDWVRIGQEVRARGMELTMTTGGRGMTPERARQAKEAGIQSASVSVDALQEMHDSLRGVQGSWRAAMEAIANLKAVGIPVSCNTQIARPALRQIEPLLEHLIAAGMHAWQVSMTVPMGRAADEPGLILEPYQVLEVMPLIARAARRLKQHRIRLWPGNDIGYFGPYETEIRGRMPRGHMAACGAGRLSLGIEADGSIKGCPSLAHWQQPLLPPQGAGAAAGRKTRAPGAGDPGGGQALRPWDLRAGDRRLARRRTGQGERARGDRRGVAPAGVIGGRSVLRGSIGRTLRPR